MLHRGTKPGALYKSAYKLGKLYKGTQLVAGYVDVSRAAPASWDGTYDDVMGVAATGKCKQQTYSGKNLLMTNRETYTQSGVTAERLADGRYHISGTPTAGASLFLAQDLSLVLAAGTYTLARTAEAQTLNIQARLLPGWKTGTFALGEALTVNACYIDLPASVIGQALDFVYAPQLETGSASTAYEPYVGGQPSPSPDYPQPGLPPAAGGGRGQPDDQRADGHHAHYRDAAGAAGHPRHGHPRHAGVHRRRSVAGDAERGCHRQLRRGECWQHMGQQHRTADHRCGGLVRAGDAHHGDGYAGRAAQLPRPHGTGRIRRLPA